MKYIHIVISIMLLIMQLNANDLKRRETACNEGKGMDCMMIASLYLTGKHVERNSVMAVKFLHKACDAGTAVGCYNLGNMYARGEGVTKEYETAKSFYKKACKKGINDACFNYKVLSKRIGNQNNSK